MKVQLSDHFNYNKIFLFTLPTILMMIFSSLYVVVDGLFVGNIVGGDALAAINIIFPLIMIVGGFGFMLGSGGNAIVARTLGEGNIPKAREYFSLILCTITLLGIVISAICILFIRPVSVFLGATDRLMDYCITYGIILLAGITLYMLQVSFQVFFITAEKPELGLFFTLGSGLTNMVLDYLFIVVFNWGIAGAAWATVTGYAVGGLIPLLYFIFPNRSLLRFTKPRLDWKVLLESSVNGSSEMVSNISYSVVTFLYNYQMLKLIGEEGVTAITVLLYVNMIFNAIGMGFSFGIAPVIGYHYGAQNHPELKNLFKRCLKIIGVVSVVMFVAAQLTAAPVTDIFCGGDPYLEEITTSGFHLYSLAFLICGFNIFGSSFFTALCNGKISAAIAFFRTLVMESAMLLLLPLIFGVTGVWIAMPVAEFMTLLLCIYFWITRRHKYHYV